MADQHVRADSLGAAVRARRRDLGLTQEQAADLAQVSLRFVHDVEHDKPTVQLDRLLRLLDMLGLHLQLLPGASSRVGT